MAAGPSQVAVREIGTTSTLAVSLRPEAGGEQQLSAELAELQLPGNTTLLQAIQAQGMPVHTEMLIPTTV